MYEFRIFLTSETYILSRDVAAISLGINSSGQIDTIDKADDILNVECQSLVRIQPHAVQLCDQSMNCPLSCLQIFSQILN